MRWVILSDDWAPCDGGVATWSMLAAEALIAEGHAVTAFVRRRAQLAPLDGGTVHGVRGPRFGRWGGFWLGNAARSQLGRADAVLATTWPVASHVVACAPTDIVAHGSDLTRPPVTRSRSKVLGRARKLWAVSRYLARGMSNAEVLPAPIAVGQSRTLPPRPRRLGFLARATSLKGGDRFIRIVAAMGVEGVMVGDGPALPAWRILADKVGASIHFAGRLQRDNALALLARTDVVILLPRTHEDGSGAEGFGLALVEGASLGIPAVGCRTGGVVESVGPGLLLDEPDDAARSGAQIEEWYSPTRGSEARDWVAAHHGPRRLVAALERGR